VKVIYLASPPRAIPHLGSATPEAMTPESGEVGFEVEISDLLPVGPPENTQPGL
jgi:hypothetical protein